MLRWMPRIAAAVLALAAATAYADFTGKVVGVVDGDTLDVLVEKRPVRVRLAEIDAPEKRQAFGTRARQKLSELTFGKTATVRDHGTDWRGTRTVGHVLVDGQDVGRSMVAAGMAWAYPQYVKDRSLYDVEARARAEGRGLWADASPTPPWRWRAEGRAAAKAQAID
ncbi:thermonuclease family protein [Xenophilus azovorans]|uniref:thermonuclease family protein n=1 Tax=Xenophilus azovorans TaxID=151755 RepID=UPI001FE0C38E|nr:thermonuclease family protein [Xenophilus azovorans]